MNAIVSPAPTQWTAPEALGLRRAQVSKIADSAARQMEYEPGGDLLKLVDKVGGTIRYASLSDELSDSGSITIDPDGFEITLSVNTSLLRDRFTVAHELGHWVLHYLYAKQVLKRNVNYMKANRYGTGAVEAEANWFAAAFLMPAYAFSEAFREHQGDHFALSAQFGVSTQASKIRAKSLLLEPQDE